MPTKLKKQERQRTRRESDRCIVPLKPEIQSGGVKPGNAVAGKATRPSRDSDSQPPAPRGRSSVVDRLDRITNRAESTPEEVFSNLFTLLTTELLWFAFRRLKRGKASGADHVSVEDYEENLHENLRDLESRLHRGTYKPQPSVRKDIPKGNGKTRPLGISAVEDKIVQRAVVMILEPVYEADFHEASYGFRPGRSCHQALATLGQIIATRKVNWVSDADIKGFFDNVSHESLLELLQIRISDPRLLTLITSFLKCGVLIGGQLSATEDGVPQGSCLSPLLANVYLHYVLDKWFERDVKGAIQGEAYLVRYADDFICCFQYESDARAFQTVLPKRLVRFSLEVAEEKTKLLRFGRFAERDSIRYGEGRPGNFEFLGFTHYCGISRAGKFKLKRRTSRKKLRQKLQDMKEWLHSVLIERQREVWKKLNAKLRGHYQYYSINDNWPELMVFLERVKWLVRRWLNRRSQNPYVSWDEFRTYSKRHPLETPGKITDLIAMSRSN